MRARTAMDPGVARSASPRAARCVDATVVAALTARAADRELTLRPRTREEEAAASTEGWIAIPLPDSQLSLLP